MSRTAIVSVLLLAFGCSGGGPAPAPEAAPAAAAIPGPELAELRFEALWWSEAQLAKLDPDDPPERATPIRLERWQRPEAKGAPGPETFDVVVSVSNATRESNLYVDAIERWGIGPLLGDGPTEWTEWQPHTRFGPLEPDAAAAELRLATIDLASRQAALFEENRWPWVYESRVIVVRGVSSDVPIAEVTRSLPIEPGVR